MIQSFLKNSNMTFGNFASDTMDYKSDFLLFGTKPMESKPSFLLRMVLLKKLIKYHQMK